MITQVTEKGYSLFTAKKKFDGLSYSKKQRFVSAIEGAKTQETRERRVQKAIEELKTP
jgi:uncharacterized protein YdeI (YjbR/CyaY-like superfamily)